MIRKLGAVTYFENYEIEKSKSNIPISDGEELLDKVILDLKNLGFEMDKYSFCDEGKNLENNGLLEFKFCKKYNDTYNKYECIEVNILVENNSYSYHIIRFSDEKYTNNDLVITKEDAINIAKTKEYEFSNSEITEVDCELSIEKMNTVIYQLENKELYMEKNNQILEVDNIARKVWKVKIVHESKNNLEEYENVNYYIMDNSTKIYYIDVSTGEIIGGDVLYKDILKTLN